MKSDRKQKVIVVTGASSGLGRLTAQELAAGGHVVYATMRNVDTTNREARDEVLASAERTGHQLRVVEIDVTCSESVNRGIDSIVKEAGRVDVVVNNAGVMNVGVSEAYSLEAVRRQFDVNLYGAVRINRAVLPQMRQRRSGLLIQLSSLAGRIVFPFFGIYCASKFAVEALAESYRYELARFGVDSVIVEPGPFLTKLIDHSPGADDLCRLRSYGSVASIPTAMLKSFTESQTADGAPDPGLVATAIRELVDMPGRRPLRTVVGIDLGVSDLNRAVDPVQHRLLDALGVDGACDTAVPAGAESQ